MAPKTRSPSIRSPKAASSWSQRYGARHHLQRISQFPTGIKPPKKVRIYLRQQHFVLQWWDPAAKTNLSDRVEGDLVAAISRARQIDERLEHFKASGKGGPRRLDPAKLVENFLEDLGKRADAGEIDPATVRRYQSALAHFLDFCRQADVEKAFSKVSQVNRDFRLQFASFLAGRQIKPNGHENAKMRPMKGQRFILDTVRALFEWAGDPDRGNLLPDGFRNPFLRPGTSAEVFKGDPLAEPDITLAMAEDFFGTCDLYQLRLFVPMLLFGLRASEPCFLFAEDLEKGWLRVACKPDLAYRTKGRRDKRFPMMQDLEPFWKALVPNGALGLLYERRAVVEGKEAAPLRGSSLVQLVKVFRQRCVAQGKITAAEKLTIRNSLLQGAGGINYDHVEQEFRRVAKRLNWPAQATTKDFRHLFSTAMANAALPEPFRRYLLGHAPGRSASVAYTHLHELERHFAAAVQKEWKSLVRIIDERVKQLA